MISSRLELRRLLLLAFIVVTTGLGLSGIAAAAGPLLLRNPSLSRDKIAFLYAGDIWTVPALRWRGPAFDLRWVPLLRDRTILLTARRSPTPRASTGQVDVYVVNAEGGVPRRLTWEPTGQLCCGLDPGWERRAVRIDARQLLGFLQTVRDPCGRNRNAQRCFRCRAPRRAAFRPTEASWPTRPILQWEDAWKHYRGGQTKKVWLVQYEEPGPGEGPAREFE